MGDPQRSASLLGASTGYPGVRLPHLQKGAVGSRKRRQWQKDCVNLKAWQSLAESPSVLILSSSVCLPFIHLFIHEIKFP